MSTYVTVSQVFIWIVLHHSHWTQDVSLL